MTSQEGKIQRHSTTDPTPILFSLFSDKVTVARMSSMMAAAMLMLSVSFSTPLPSEAAMTGGRMGGSYSSPSRSSSYSSPSSRSSYSSGSSRYSGGGGTAYYSRPSTTTIITPGYSTFGSPFVSPVVPYYGGGGAVAISRGPSIFDLIFFGAFLYVAVNVVQGMTTNEGGSTSSSWDTTTTSALGPGSTVVQLSVAVQIANRDDPTSLLSVLDRLSQTARTDSRVGLQNLTSQVALELLRQRSSIVSAVSKSDHYRESTTASRSYQKMTVQERSKFEQETVNQYGGVDYAAPKKGLLNNLLGSSNKDDTDSNSNSKATMAVVTLLLSIQGDQTKLPKINNLQQVEAALQMIATDAKVEDCLQSAEILWTPEDRRETLSPRDVVVDYPELRSV